MRAARSGCCAGCTPGATPMSRTQGLLPLGCSGALPKQQFGGTFLCPNTSENLQGTAEVLQE